MSVTIVRAVRTCWVCPSQWSAWDADGNYWYLRYRWGTGSAVTPSPGNPDTYLTFDTGDSLDGYIELDEFCRKAGLILALETEEEP